MTDEEELGLTEEELAHWHVDEPPTDFADGVIGALEGPSSGPVEPKTPWRSYGVAAVMLVTGAAAVAFAWNSPETARDFAADTRQEIAFSRGVLVAEPGAAGTVRTGDATVVEQDQGSVFYRVDKGGPFRVETPAGTVTVRGTCFRVEVSEMRIGQAVGGAAVGAAVTAVTLVSVYEGRVAVANDQGTIEVGAGEFTSVTAGEAPASVEETDREDGWTPREAEAQADLRPADHPALGQLRADDDLSLPELRERHEALLRRAEAQAREVERLQERLDEVDGNDRDLDNLFYPTTEEDLRILAERCEVRVDYPPVLGIEPGDVGDELGDLQLSAEEHAAVQDAVNRLHGSFLEELRELYAEATGDTETMASLSPQALLAELRDKSPRNIAEQTMSQIAQERAGLQPPTPEVERLPYERAVRRYSNLGNEFQSLLAQSLGHERASELRAQKSGWPWSRSRFGGCPDE
ncbi:MAG: FecR domain-containing protein [Myxococcota bacterium]